MRFPILIVRLIQPHESRLGWIIAFKVDRSRFVRGVGYVFVLHLGLYNRNPTSLKTCLNMVFSSLFRHSWHLLDDWWLAQVAWMWCCLLQLSKVPLFSTIFPATPCWVLKQLRKSSQVIADSSCQCIITNGQPIRGSSLPYQATSPVV